MTRTAFDKFAWIKALQADTTLTDRDFRLAVLIGVSYTRADGSGWAVELDALAAALPGGLSRRRLSDALGRLVKSGYLAQSSKSVGGRGFTARRAFELRKPRTPASGVSDQTRDSADGGLAGADLWITRETLDASGTGLAETPDASVRNPGRQRPKPLTLASEKMPDELHQYPPTGTSSGTSSGTDAAREPACVFCRDDGWLLDDDGTPVDPAIRCTHTPAMARYTPAPTQQRTAP